MSHAPDLESQYNNRAAVPEHVDIAARWDKDAAAYRAAADAELDIPYGESERTRFDFFRGEGASGGEPVIAYIHGGFWRSRDRKTYSHMARGFNARGISLAIPSYDHCPAVSVMDIIGQMRAFLAVLWEKTKTRPAVAGNSAGGHLAGCMFATDWSRVGGVPDDLVRCAYGLSGLYDLAPCVELSVNEDLKLTPASAREASPGLWPLPAHARDYVAAVGSLESDEFKRQSRELTQAWAKAGADADCLEIAGVNHFTIVDALADPDGDMAARLARMAESAARE